MNNNTRLRDLLDKYVSNSCTRSELEELLDILKRAENEPEIKKVLSETWASLFESGGSEEKSFQQGNDEWFEEIVAEARAREAGSAKKIIHKTRPEKSKTFTRRRVLSQWVKVAAILLFTSFLSLAYYSVVIETSSDDLSSVVYNQKTAGPGEKVRFILSDGTQVHLNSESRIEYPASFDGKAREVRLDGEAYFVVAHDSIRPFLVHANEITTKVLGTSFNVRSYPESKEAVVAVATGKVAVLESGTEALEENYSVVLEANQWTNYNEQNFTTQSGDISIFTAWNNDILFYKDKKLNEVSDQLERWYGVDITFKDEAIKDCFIRGEHRGETLENVLEAITYAFVDMEYQINDRRVTLMGRGCK